MRMSLWIVTAFALGALSGAQAADTHKAKADSATVKLSVTGMHCDGCASAVEKAIRGVAGVKDARVDRKSGHATVTTEPKVKAEDLATAVNKTKKFSAKVVK